MATVAQISSSVCCYSSVRDICAFNAAKSASSARFPRRVGTAFATGSPLLIQIPFYRRNSTYNPKTVSIRCEQSSKQGNGLDVWLGRLAMVGFAAAISVEIATGKGLLENFGLTAPLPTVALAVTALVGVLTAVVIFQSASEN
ncbi:Stress enhanced protein 1, chloroplastic [Sesamum angolense]|uniref:Stress enhanced protein 1, chloroplastic n=1 Tax=Sesamum angolense TaxID=2727404 RepID=A0AAE2BXT3_9LAMI|nr:Stress enhanced protein 1, chloroplastic [Sesamum angolense]